MSSSKQFSYHEFFKMSLEQYLIVKCSFIKQAVEEAQKKEEKRQIIQDFINEFVVFSKNVIGKNSKNCQIIIAEIIEKMLIVDFSLMRKKEDEFPRDVLNRPYKLMMLQFDRLMYDYLTSADKVPKGFNYREKFDTDMTKHLDQIKVYSKMNFSSPSDGDAVLQKIFRSLLQNCISIEFYTFLSNFCIRNELSKEIKKYVRNEYQALSQKFSVRQAIHQNQKISSHFNDELSKSQIKEHNNLITSNNNSNPAQQNGMEGNSQGSEHFSGMVDFGDENKSINANKNQQGRKQFSSIFLGNKALGTTPLQQHTNNNNNNNVQQLHDNFDSKSSVLKKKQSKSQYLPSGNGENSLCILMEEENSNNHSNQFAETNKNFIQENHTDFGYNSCGINSEENTQFNLINFKGFQNKINVVNEHDKNSIDKNEFEFNNNINNNINKQQQKEKKKEIKRTSVRIQSSSVNNNQEICDNDRKMKNYSLISDNNSNNIALASPKQSLNEAEDKNMFGKKLSSVQSSELSGAKGQSQSVAGSTINQSNSKLVQSNNKRQLSKPIQSGRTMYSVLNKKILRNSQTKSTIQQQQKPLAQMRSNSKNNNDYPGHSNSNSHNGTNNILFEAAQKLLQEQDQRRQNKMKLMSRESNKYQQSDPFSSVATKTFKTPSTQDNFLEGYQHINNQQSLSEEENSLPLMYMWGHN